MLSCWDNFNKSQFDQEAAMKKYAETVAMLLDSEKLNAASSVIPCELKSIDGLDIVAEGPVLRVTLNRPKKYNALTTEVCFWPFSESRRVFRLSFLVRIFFNTTTVHYRWILGAQFCRCYWKCLQFGKWVLGSRGGGCNNPGKQM